MSCRNEFACRDLLIILFHCEISFLISYEFLCVLVWGGWRIENFPVEFEFLQEERIDFLCFVSLIMLLIFQIHSFDWGFIYLSEEIQLALELFHTALLSDFLTFLDKSMLLVGSCFDLFSFFLCIIFSYFLNSILNGISTSFS